MPVLLEQPRGAAAEDLGEDVGNHREGTSETASRGCDGRVSGWDTRSGKRRVPGVHKRSCDKVDRPKRGRPSGLRQNAAPASPPSSVIGSTITFVVRLAFIRTLLAAQPA